MMCFLLQMILNFLGAFIIRKPAWQYKNGIGKKLHDWVILHLARKIIPMMLPNVSPFIEAYAMVGEWDKAINLSTQTLQVSELYKPIVCKLWDRIYQNSVDRIDSNLSVLGEFVSSNCG